MKRKLMLLLACLLASIGLVIAQTPKKVTGVVISEEDDQPVVGASVLVKGTTMGTVTDIDGKFTINDVPSSARTLKISYIGMKTQEIPIKSRNDKNSDETRCRSSGGSSGNRYAKNGQAPFHGSCNKT